MAKLRLYGKKTRCWWCGKPVTGEPRALNLEFGGEQFECIVCPDRCGESARAASHYVERFVPLFIVGILVSLLLTFVPNFSVMMCGFLLLGITILICPFCTPQTTRALGMKNSFVLGRIIGCILVAAASAIWFLRN